MPACVEVRLRDILDAIAEIEEILADYDVDMFSADKTRRMATARYLEVICEAARHLTDEVRRDAPGIEWQRMVDLGNQLRHAYHATDVNIICVQNHLPPLKSFVERRIRASGS